MHWLQWSESGPIKMKPREFLSDNWVQLSLGPNRNSYDPFGQLQTDQLFAAKPIQIICLLIKMEFNWAGLWSVAGHWPKYLVAKLWFGVSLQFQVWIYIWFILWSKTHMNVTPLCIPHKLSYWDGCKFIVWCCANLVQSCSFKLALTWHPCKDQKRANIRVDGLACPLHLPGDPVFVLGVVCCLLMVMGCPVCCSWCSLPRKEMQTTLTDIRTLTSWVWKCHQ